jgi:LacI family transcriptional regulator
LSNRITMADVANQAGVSIMTVSRAVNGKEGISDETRLKVLEVIKTLGYRPSGIARSLATQKTLTLGLVVPDISNPFFSEVTRGVEQFANQHGYRVFLGNTEEDSLRELALIQSLEEKGVDGLILCSSRLEEDLLVDIVGRLPAVVLINRRLLVPENDAAIDSVILDETGGAEQAVHHLISRGHSAIGFLAGPPASFSGRGRLLGYQRAMQSERLPIQPGWIFHCGPSVEAGQQAALQLLQEHPELSALFCYNDLVAVGALHAGSQLQRRVPQDLAIVGYDDIPLAALVFPSLTTCRSPRLDLGSHAVEALIQRIHGCPGGCEHQVLPVELIIRNSAP